jgi:hypothetical protein
VGAHFPLDIAGGAALGLAVNTAVGLIRAERLILRKSRPRGGVSPLCRRADWSSRALDREPRADLEAAFGTRPGLDDAAVEGCSLAHPDQAVAGAVGGLAGGGGSAAVVEDLELTVLFFALPVALAMLAIAAVRGGLAPRWVIPAAVLFVLADFAPVPGAEIVQMALGLAAFGRIAKTIFGMSDAEWESASPAGVPASGRPAAAPVG